MPRWIKVGRWLSLHSAVEPAGTSQRKGMMQDVSCLIVIGRARVPIAQRAMPSQLYDASPTTLTNTTT